MVNPSTVRRDDVLFTVNQFPQHGWHARINDDDGAVQIVFGPASPPIGLGSVRLFMPTSTVNDSVEIRLSTFDGTLVRDLDDLRYWTYVQNPGQLSGQFPFIILDVNNGTEQDFLIFEPTYQQAAFNPTIPDQGPLLLNTWQDWNALAGGWWSVIHPEIMSPGTGVKQLSAYLAVFPNTFLSSNVPGLGAIRLLQGFTAQQPLEGFVDAFSIQTRQTGMTSTYNFDPPFTPSPPSGGRVVRLRQPMFVSDGVCFGSRISRPFLGPTR